MSYSDHDAMIDSELSRLEEEHLWEKSKLLYRIFLFVEGETEEQVLPEIINDAGYDLEENSIEIANYNGINNLTHSIRLLRKTLSYKSPIIVTFDNDTAGNKEYNKLLAQQDISKNIEPIFFYKFPSAKPEIDYKTHKGGSFEEIFDFTSFIEACFQLNGIPERMIIDKHSIISNFIINEPWLKQIKGILLDYDYSRDIDKIFLSLRMNNIQSKIPQDILNLIYLLKEVRNKYPIKHIDDDFEYPEWLKNI